MKPDDYKLAVLVVDDHDYCRRSLTAFLKEIPFVDIVGEAKDGIEAEEMALSLSPHLLIMDIKMPRRNGLEAAKEIKGHNPAVKIILYSMYEAENYKTEELKNVDGFIPKEKLFEDIVKKIEEIK